MRRWISDTDHRWVMACEGRNYRGEYECPDGVVSPPRRHQGELPLADFAAAGWSIGRVHGDRCPGCVERYGPTPDPHPRHGDDSAARPADTTTESRDR